MPRCQLSLLLFCDVLQSCARIMSLLYSEVLEALLPAQSRVCSFVFYSSQDLTIAWPHMTGTAQLHNTGGMLCRQSMVQDCGKFLLRCAKGSKLTCNEVHRQMGTVAAEA